MDKIIENLTNFLAQYNIDVYDAKKIGDKKATFNVLIYKKKSPIEGRMSITKAIFDYNDKAEEKVQLCGLKVGERSDDEIELSFDVILDKPKTTRDSKKSEKLPKEHGQKTGEETMKKDSEFSEKTKQGYEIVKTFKDKGGRKYAILKRKNDFVIANGYDEMSGEWDQGYYGYTSVDEAEKTLRKHIDEMNKALYDSKPTSNSPEYYILGKTKGKDGKYTIEKYVDGKFAGKRGYEEFDVALDKLYDIEAKKSLFVTQLDNYFLCDAKKKTRDAKDTIEIRWRDLSSKENHRDNFSAKDFDEAFRKLADQIAGRGIGTINVLVISASKEDGTALQKSGRLSEFLETMKKDSRSVKDVYENLEILDLLREVLDDEYILDCVINWMNRTQYESAMKSVIRQADLADQEEFEDFMNRESIKDASNTDRFDVIRETMGDEATLDALLAAMSNDEVDDYADFIYRVYDIAEDETIKDSVKDDKIDWVNYKLYRTPDEDGKYVLEVLENGHSTSEDHWDRYDTFGEAYGHFKDLADEHDLHIRKFRTYYFAGEFPEKKED